jgi:glycosyltransferase involved in cell wall biosynthesis
MSRERVIVVAARNEEDRITPTLDALARAFPGARVIVASDGSRDRTSAFAAAAGAEVLEGAGRGKGEAMTAAAQRVLEVLEVLEDGPSAATVLFCDGDLAASAGRLGPLAEAVESGECDLAVAAFARREGGGFGIAVGFSRWAIKRLTGLELKAPISGQRALPATLLPALLPFASGFGAETAMTIDAVRAGARVKEIELDLDHRVTGRTLSGFLHRARQLRSFVAVYLSRSLGRRVPAR